VWCRGQKLHSHADSLASAITRKHDSALLLILRQWIHQDDRFALVYFVVQHQQTAMRVHHHRLTHLTEFSPVVAASLRLHPHLVKDALASPGRRKCGLIHMLMMRFTLGPVNCPLGQVSPIVKQPNCASHSLLTSFGLFLDALYPTIPSRTI